jgi:hypothetical protein
MQTQDWIELFRTIPEPQHNTLVLTTLSGVDLSIDTIMRTEPNYLVFRGRVCGQTDEGRLFFLPYRQIDFLQLNQLISESEIQELLSGMPDEPPTGQVGSAVVSDLGFTDITPPPGAAQPEAPISNVPLAALVPPPASAAGKHEAAAAPRSSILERLRAQRNSVLPPRPPAR